MFTSTYIQHFKDYLHSNLCNQGNKTYFKDCDVLVDSLAKNGLEIIIIRFFEYLRIANFQFIIRENDQSAIDILNDKIFQDICIFLHYYIKPTLRIITNEMKQNIDNNLISEMNFRWAIFICFLVFLVLGYLIFWLPFQNKLNDEILRTKMMLEIIPQSILKNLKV